MAVLTKHDALGDLCQYILLGVIAFPNSELLLLRIKMMEREGRWVYVIPTVDTAPFDLNLPHPS